MANNYMNSLAWMALKARADWEAQEQAKAERAAQDRLAAQQIGMRQADQVSQQVDREFQRQAELAKMAGEAAAYDGELSPAFKSGQFGMIQDIARRHKMGAVARQMDMEKLRQQDDLVRAGLREKEIEHRIGYQRNQAELKDFESAMAGDTDLMAWKMTGAQLGVPISGYKDIISLQRDPKAIEAWQKNRSQIEQERTSRAAAGADKSTVVGGDYVPAGKKGTDAAASDIRITQKLDEDFKYLEGLSGKLFGARGKVGGILSDVADYTMGSAAPKMAQDFIVEDQTGLTKLLNIISEVTKERSGLAVTDSERKVLQAMSAGIESEGLAKLSGVGEVRFKTAINTIRDILKRNGVYGANVLRAGGQMEVSDLKFDHELSAEELNRLSPEDLQKYEAWLDAQNAQ